MTDVGFFTCVTANHIVDHKAEFLLKLLDFFCFHKDPYSHWISLLLWTVGSNHSSCGSWTYQLPLELQKKKKQET